MKNRNYTKKNEKSICHKKDGNYQNQGKARKFKKKESSRNVVSHKVGNVWSRRAWFPIWGKDASKKTSLVIKKENFVEG